MDIDQLFQRALDMLRRNLDTYPSFDPNGLYEDKNKYFLEVSQLSSPLFAEAIRVPFVERYYRTMVDTIHEYEQRAGKTFNKGIVYGNLGVILTAQGNLDEGIHFLLLADKEDEPFKRDPHGVIQSDLWEQFENRHVIAHLMQLDTNANASLHFTVDKAFIIGFLRTMELSDRLLLEATIWTMFRNLEFNQVNSNDYTRGRLYSGLKDLCLLTETLLRKKQIALGLVVANTQVMLGTLLTNALRGVGIAYPHPGLPIGANSLQSFIDNLEIVLHTSPNPEIRRIACLHLVRNFTGHHFDVSSRVVSASGNEFFALYEETLTNILSAVLYLAHEALI